MNIIFFMIGVSIFIASGFLMAFLWAMKTGQNDDLVTPGMRILLDEKYKDTNENKKAKS